jgi:ethanolamine transporter EutH
MMAMLQTSRTLPIALSAVAIGYCCYWLVVGFERSDNEWIAYSVASIILSIGWSVALLTIAYVAIRLCGSKPSFELWELIRAFWIDALVATLVLVGKNILFAEKIPTLAIVDDYWTIFSIGAALVLWRVLIILTFKKTSNWWMRSLRVR